jgi:hypothetical protein
MCYSVLQENEDNSWIIIEGALQAIETDEEDREC